MVFLSQCTYGDDVVEFLTCMYDSIVLVDLTGPGGRFRYRVYSSRVLQHKTQQDFWKPRPQLI